MLLLLLRVGDQRFGLDATDVVEVIPSVPLLPVPRAPAWIAGVLRHRDGLAPVVDLVQLIAGTPASRRLSTRIVLLRQSPSATSTAVPRPDSYIGMLAEKVTATVRIDPARLRDAGLQSRDAPWLGPVALDVDGPLQLVRWTDLVPADLRRTVLDEVQA